MAKFRKLAWVVAVVALIFGVRVYVQGPLTPAMNLRVRTDSNGYLIVSGLAYTGSDGPLTAFGNIRLRTDSNGYLLTTFGSGGYTAPFTVSGNGIAVTSTDGIVAQNTTASTVGVPVQMAPRYKDCGTAWNSVGTASEIDCWIIENLPATVAGATTSTLKFGVSIAGGAYTYPFTVSSAGVGTLTSLSVSAGSAAAPPIKIGTNPNGFDVTGNAILIDSNGTYSQAYNYDLGGQVKIIAAGNFAWAPSGTITTTADTGLSRGAAGAVYVGNGGGGDASGLIKAGSYSLTALMASTTAPTISSGFGSSPSIASNNGTAAFTVNVGTGGTATNGVIGLPTAATGWRVACADVTTQSTTVFMTKQIARSTTTATIANYNTAGAQAAWVASDILVCDATAY